MKIKLIDILVLASLIATSGFQFFYINEEWIIIAIVFVLIVSIFSKNKSVYTPKGLLIISIFVLWETVQFFILGGFRFISLLGTAARFFLFYLVLSYLNTRFINTYVKLINYLAIISLIFYIVLFIPGIDNFLFSLSKNFKPVFETEFIGYEYKPNILIFNLHGYEFTPRRNSGPFWEPGAFAVFINLALAFNVLIDKSFNFKRNFWLLLALITTFSTTGFIVGMLTITAAILFNAKKVFVNILLVLLLIYPFYALFTNLDFLLPKINNDIEFAQQTTGSRFGSAVADIQLISKNPVLGYGRNIEAMYGISFFIKQQMHRNNGLTKLFVQWGLLAILFLYLTYIGFRNISLFYSNNKYYSYLFMIVLLLNAFSQPIFQYPFFMGSALYFTVYKSNKVS